MAIETLENCELIETADVIPQSCMQLFVAVVVEHFKDPKNQKKFEEWKKNKSKDV